MAKTIPAELVAHKAQTTIKTCRLLLVGPLPDATYRGFASLDRNVTYDPNSGVGPQVFRARTGIEVTALVATNTLGVDNGEARTLAPIETFEFEGFTQAQIDAGDLDKVPFVLYEVNADDLTPGRHEIMAGGTIGEQRQKFGQLTVLELRSLSQQLKQTIGELDSLNCRAPFGSQPGEVRFPCGFDLTAEWIAGEVTSVAVGESDRVFTDTALLQADDYFSPGVVEWLTGANAGQETEIEAFAAGVVDLKFPTVQAIAIGDTFRIRRECTKRASGHNSCRTFYDTEWVLHFRGEPHIPIGDTDKLNTPGAGTAQAGLGATGEAIAGALWS